MNNQFNLATSSWDQAEIDAMQQVIDSGRLTMGDRVLQFESDFAQYIGSKYCVMVNSGSSANLLMTAALFYTQRSEMRLARGDEIIVPAVSWSTSYFPLYQYGLKLKFVDIDLNTLNYDLEKLSQAVTDKTKAILAVNLLGNPNDFNALQALVDDFKSQGKTILLLEDNCESLGATFSGKMAGTFGLMGTFSTYFSHHISTIEGGMVVTDDEELYHILLSLRAHGWTRNLPENNQVCTKNSGNPFYEKFRFVLPGYNLRPMELTAAIGIEQIKKLPDIVNNRRKNAELMQEVFGDSSDILLQQEIGESSWFGFSLVVKRGARYDRETLIEKFDEAGIESRPIVTGNFVNNDVVKRYIDHEVFSTLENADYVDQNGLMIGNHHYGIEGLIDALKGIL